MPMIAAVGFDSAAVGVHGVEFRRRVLIERISRFKENAPVVQDIHRQKVSWRMRERQRLLVADGNRGNFQDEFSGQLVRINKTIRRNVKWPHTVVVAVCNLAWRAGSSSGDRDFPDLPVITGLRFPCEEHIISIEGHAGVRSGKEAGEQCPVAAFPLDENCGSIWEPVRAANPRQGVVLLRDRI